MSTDVPPSSSRKQAWPRNVISTLGLLSLSHELVGELEPDGDADEHPEPRLLGDERADGEQPLGLVGRSRDLRDVARRARRRTSRRCRAPRSGRAGAPGAAWVTISCACAKRSGSPSASTARSTSSAL